MGCEGNSLDLLLLQKLADKEMVATSRAGTRVGYQANSRPGCLVLLPCPAVYLCARAHERVGERLMCKKRVFSSSPAIC